MPDYNILSDEDIGKIFETRLQAIREIVLVKAKEYTRNGDRLSNFRNAAKRRNKTMLEVLDGYLDKHLESFYDMIQDVKDGRVISQKFLDDKITDIMVYMMLAEVITQEHNQNT